jgi:capsular exopolysaccharide synthesis family protein
MQDAAITRYRKHHPGGKMSDEELRRAFEKKLKLTLLRRTRLVKIEFNHTDPVFAAQACIAFAEAAEASVYDENRVASDAAVVWLEAQSVTQRADLEKADNALLKYRQDNKIDVLESQRKTVDEALMDFNKVLVDLESQEAKERDLLNTLSTIDLTPESAGRLPASIPRAEEIKAAIDKWMASVAERDALLSKYTAKHPEVESKDKMVSLFRNQALEALNRSKATSASNLDLFKQQAASLRQKKAEQSKLASDLELQIVERRTQLTALERTRDASDAAYRGILSRIQEARMAADENTANVKIVERAPVPEKPVSPRPVQVIALAILLGLMGGIGLSLVTDQMEDHITGPHDLEAGMGIKVVALVPRVKASDRREIATATINQRFSEIAEVFAGLRSVLGSTQYKDHSKVVLIASSVPEEGKTITSCNLASAWAKNGRSTLLIDFDLRRPRIAGIFPMPAGFPGLLEFLSQPETGIEFASLVYPSGCPNLFIIASRPTEKASPAELVGGDRVTALLAWARQRFDHVVIDAPPLGLVSDALVLAGHADCTLVVARPETSRKRATFHTIRRLRETGVHLIASVINDVDFSKGSSYYSPNYHDYGHYKSYPSDPEKAKS